MGDPLSVGTDRRARFEEVFDAAYVPVQRYVRRRGGGETDDVVADTFMVVWRRLDDVPSEAVVPWCLGAARRCLANQRRSTKRRALLRDRVAREPAPVDDDSGDVDLVAALARLDDEQRELLRLSVWEGFGAGEIAVVLGITPNAVSIRLHRARRELADLLGAGKKSDGGGHSSVDTRNRKEER